MSIGTIIVLVIVVLAVVLGLGYLILTLMRRSQTAVPGLADPGPAASQNRIVGTDEAGRPVTAAEEGEAEPRDTSAFEAVLKEELAELDVKPEDEAGQ